VRGRRRLKRWRPFSAHLIGANSEKIPPPAGKMKREELHGEGQGGGKVQGER
jgi:hypothetical protein